MNTPHDDDPGAELLDVPDHGPEFWDRLDAGLAGEPRADVVPLAPERASRHRGRGVLLAAAAIVILGGIGAYVALRGDGDRGPDVAVDPETVPTSTPEVTGVAPEPTDSTQSVSATVERTGPFVGRPTTFELTTTFDGAIILRGEEETYGYSAQTGLTWYDSATTSRSAIDPLWGDSSVRSILMADLADSVRFAGIGEVVEVDGRRAISATVELADDASAGTADLTAEVVIDDETGLMLEATVTEADGTVVETVTLSDIEFSTEAADVGGALDTDSEWVVHDGVPTEPVVGDGYYVPVGMDPVRVFTTTKAVGTGSEATNPVTEGAYVVEVETAPWHRSRIIVLGGGTGTWTDPLGAEGRIFERSPAIPDGGVLAGVEGELSDTPPIAPSAWFELGDEIIAVDRLVDPGTADRLWTLEVREEDPVDTVALPEVTWAWGEEQTAFAFEGGRVVARRLSGGMAGSTSFLRAADELWWEPAGAEPRPIDIGPEPVVLFDAFLGEGEVFVIYGDAPPQLSGQEPSGDLILQRIAQPRSEATVLGPSVGVEYGVGAVSSRGPRIVVSAGADLGEFFSFHDMAGNELDLSTNPVPVGHRYGQPPAYEHAALGADWTTLAFVEGPDWSQEEQAEVGDWQLVVVDLDSGAETTRIPLFDRGTVEVSHLDFDGTWAVVSRDDQVIDRAEPLAALAVDTRDGSITEIEGSAGIATVKR